MMSKLLICLICSLSIALAGCKVRTKNVLDESICDAFMAGIKSNLSEQVVESFVSVSSTEGLLYASKFSSYLEPYGMGENFMCRYEKVNDRGNTLSSLSIFIRRINLSDYDVSCGEGNLCYSDVGVAYRLLFVNRSGQEKKFYQWKAPI